MTIAIEEKTKSFKSVFKITGGIFVSVSYFYFLLSFPTQAQAPVLKVLPPEVVISTDNSFKNLIDMQYSQPVSVQLPSVGIDASIEHVTVDPDGAMQVPKNFKNIGWLTSSSKMGESGNLVLSGHFDTNMGAPAAFYNLTSLKARDVIVVQSINTSGLNKSKTYIVTDKYLADPNSVEDIFNAYKQTSEPTITLITCYGIWDSIKQEYSERLVVKGKLVN